MQGKSAILMAVMIWWYKDEVERKIESKDYFLIGGVIEIATHI